MRVVTSLLMLGLMTGVFSKSVSAQSGAVKSIDEVVTIAIKALHLESKVQTPEQIATFKKKMTLENLNKMTKLTNTQITQKVVADYQSIKQSYDANVKSEVQSSSAAQNTNFYAGLEVQGKVSGYNPSAEKTMKIWSEVLGMNTKHAEMFHSALIQTPEGKASLTKIAAWEMAFTRNLGSDMDKASILKLIELETVAAAKHIQVTGSKVCDNLSGEGLAGFANYIEQVVKTAKVNMPAVELKNHMEDTYTKEFKRDGEQALKEVCANCPGTIKC